MTANFPAISLAILIYVSVGFVLSIMWRRNDVADVLWGPGIWIASVTALVTSGHSMATAPLAYLLCGLILLWSARIAWQIGSRFLSKNDEDARYAGWRKSWRFFYFRSFGQVFLLQGLLMILVAMSAIAATSYQGGSPYQSAAVLIGCLIFLFGLLFEAVADTQLNAFVKAKTDKTEILTTGLWRYSRHPNYFGEVTAWWGIWIIAIAPAIAAPSAANLAIALLALISPVTITFLILKVSGIPMLESKYAGNQTFQAYKERTSAFFPWFPSEQVGSHVPLVLLSPQPVQHTRTSK